VHHGRKGRSSFLSQALRRGAGKANNWSISDGLQIVTGVCCYGCVAESKETGAHWYPMVQSLLQDRMVLLSLLHSSALGSCSFMKAKGKSAEDLHTVMEKGTYN
jgi:hypothetical protein